MKSVITLTAPPRCQKLKLLRNKNRDNISSGSLGSTHCQHDLFVKTTGHFSFEEFWLLVTIIERRLPCTCTFSPPGVWFWTADSGPGDGGWAPAGGVASQSLVTHARLMSIAGGEGRGGSCLLMIALLELSPTAMMDTGCHNWEEK